MSTLFPNTDTCQTSVIPSSAVQTSVVYKNLKNWDTDFVRHTQCFLPGMKVQWDECGGRIKLGDSTGDEEFLHNIKPSASL
jgi:hypothetical protein